MSFAWGGGKSSEKQGVKGLDLRAGGAPQSAGPLQGALNSTSSPTPLVPFAEG